MAAVPGFRVDPAVITAAAGRLRSQGQAVEDAAGRTVDLWATIGTSYQAPEQQQLVNAIVPLRPRAAESHQVSGQVADALATFADQVDEVLQRIRSLTGSIPGGAVPDPDMQAELDALTYEYARYELDCANAIRRALGLADLSPDLFVGPLLSPPPAAESVAGEVFEFLLDLGLSVVGHGRSRGKQRPDRRPDAPDVPDLEPAAPAESTDRSTAADPGR